MQITKRTKIIWGVLLLLLAGTGGGLWWARQTPPPPVMPAPAPSPKTPKIPRAEKTPAAAPVKSTASAAAPASGVTAVPVSLTAGNLGRLTALKGEVEELKLEVQLEELRAKKKGLLNPAPVVSAPARLPELSLPAMTPPKTAPASPPVLSSAPQRAGTAVVSVRGVDGEVSAVVRTGSGTVTLRKGSRFGGGVVTDISRNGVIVSRGGKTAALPFE